MSNEQWKLSMKDVSCISLNGVLARQMLNVKYGSDIRNMMDIWIPENMDRTVPMVVFIHGGGFRQGDKQMLNPQILRGLLSKGIAVSAMNYRYRTTTPLHVILREDVARGIQFLRYNAEVLRLNKSKFGAYGGSAGGGASLWLGVRDDLQDPTNPDPVLRESSKIQAIGHLNSQATYDISQWPEITGYKSSPVYDVENLTMTTGLNQEEINSAKGAEIRKELDMLSWLDADDAPLLIINTNEENEGGINHTPRHGKYLREKAEAAGIETIGIFGPENSEKGNVKYVVDFFVKILNRE